MKRQKGQAVVEFAIVLPFFLMLLFGVMYSGLLYTDYLTLTNVARSSAREASIQGSASYGDIRTYYAPNGRHTKLLTNLYTWQGDANDFRFSQGMSESGADMVTVTIKTSRNNNFPGVRALSYIGVTIPADYTIEYSMHAENT